MVDKPTYEELEKRIKELEGDADKQKQTEKTLLYRTKLETLISEISTLFINVNSEAIDETINYSLRLLGEFVHADRCYLFLVSDDGLYVNNIHEWCADNIESHIENLKDVPVDIHPWLIGKLKNMENVVINRIDDLPPEAAAEKEALQSLGIRSAIAVPLEYKDKLVGFLGFNYIKKGVLWKEEDTLLLRITGNIFINAFKQKQAEDTLKESQDRLRTILGNLPGDVVVHDLKGKILLVNDEACRVKGYPEEDMLNMYIQDIAPDSVIRNDRNNVWEKLKPGKAVSFETVSVRKDGLEYISEVHLNSVELEGQQVVLAISFDITEHRHLQKMLAQSAEFERLINEISAEFAGLSSNEMDESINRALASIGAFAGADRVCVFLYHDDNEIDADTQAWYADGIKSLMESYRDSTLTKYHSSIVKHLDKFEVFYVSDVAGIPDEYKTEREYLKKYDVKSILVVPMKVEDRLVGILSLKSVKKTQAWSNEVQVFLRLIGETLSNAIERKRVEKEQEELQRKLSDAMEIAHLGPYEYDLINDVFIFNDHFYKIFRTTTKQMGGNKMSRAEYFRRFIHPDDLPFIEKNIQYLKESNPGFIGQCEHRIHYSDGETGHISVWQSVEKDFNGNPVRIYGVIQDITERKLTEKKLRESEERLARSKKMESLGLLAGGVAHDLNNVLSGIVSYPELLLMQMPEESEFRKPVKTIQESGNRAVAIVQDLLTIARGAASTREPLNLNAIVNDYLKSPEHMELEQYYPDARIKTELDKELLNISGSPIHLRKVVMNLVSNASEAIESRGDITISTSNRYLDRPLRRYEEVKIGEYAVLSVSDSGSGIPADSLERIFEPFFTKKVIGRSGTGLGLAVVWNILQDHDGYVNVSSDEGGTTFDLYFPITRDEINKKDMHVSIEMMKGNGETILVVDDVESQREISCSILSVLDYKAVAMPSGEDAVEYLKENSADLILLDMIMDPGINGRETYERIIKTRPDQKAIIVSGFAETDEVRKAQALGAGKYIKKPLTLERIGIAIKKELAS